MKESKRKIEKEDILVPQERGKEGFGLISETEKKGLYSEGLDPGHAKINLMYKLGSKSWIGVTASRNMHVFHFLTYFSFALRWKTSSSLDVSKTPNNYRLHFPHSLWGSATRATVFYFTGSIASPH